MANFQLQLDDSLDQKIIEFKKDPEKMKIVNDFLNQLFEQAKVEAEQKMNVKQRNKFDVFHLQNGTRRIGAWSSRARTSARSFASRVFTTICNCTTTVRNATNAAINRN
ncbi:hypothetical protein RN001_004189 [Aquatica leii]|uniref:Uncharacterized protein n=1 Tax=Aquatica leii TaxID=1421715 RepID=A0AAN7P506_9COLE|nr:hypothetical protein RN001_004189 [Aquatica leii]